LDSHLIGPIADNSPDLFHVYFSSPGSDTGTPFAILDVDDTSSFGPETTTIVQQFQGVYTYSVYDYSNGGATTSEALATSGATVQVYRENQLVRTFNVPAGIGILWTVFELDGDTITPINTLTNDLQPSIPSETGGAG
jgi:uncharacterized protein YfaP (DUF2135 family)